VQRVVADALERTPMLDGVQKRALQRVGGEPVPRQVVDGAALVGGGERREVARIAELDDRRAGILVEQAL